MTNNIVGNNKPLNLKIQRLSFSSGLVPASIQIVCHLVNRGIFLFTGGANE
jgi:hypothetical protein